MPASSALCLPVHPLWIDSPLFWDEMWKWTFSFQAPTETQGCHSSALMELSNDKIVCWVSDQRDGLHTPAEFLHSCLFSSQWGSQWNYSRGVAFWDCKVLLRVARVKGHVPVTCTIDMATEDICHHLGKTDLCCSLTHPWCGSFPKSTIPPSEVVHCLAVTDKGRADFSGQHRQQNRDLQLHSAPSPFTTSLVKQLAGCTSFGQRGRGLKAY